MARGETDDVRANEAKEFYVFAQAISEVEHDYEFVVIDTPASDSYLMRLAHSLADTLVSPLNDSYVDVDVFSRVQHDRGQRGAVSQYAELVLQARRKRRIVDNGLIDWVMVRNRIASIASNNAKQIAISIAAVEELGFRVADGLHDRVIFRELFPIGLTALDPIEEARQRGALTDVAAVGPAGDRRAASPRWNCRPGRRGSSTCNRAGSGMTGSTTITASSRRGAAGDRGVSVKTALCFTPDLSFFAPAVRTIASLVEHGDAEAFDIFIVCEPADVAPGFESARPGAASAHQSDEVDFSTLDGGSRPKGAFRARCSGGCFSTGYCRRATSAMSRSMPTC